MVTLQHLKWLCVLVAQCTRYRGIVLTPDKPLWSSKFKFSLDCREIFPLFKSQLILFIYFFKKPIENSFCAKWKFTHLGHKWSSVLGNVGSATTSVTICVSSLYHNTNMWMRECYDSFGKIRTLTDLNRQFYVTKSQLVHPRIEFVSIISPCYVFWPNYEGPNTLILQLH